MKERPYFFIPAIVFVMICGIFLSFYPNKMDAQLALHQAWYSDSGRLFFEIITSWGEAYLFIITIIALIGAKRYRIAWEFTTTAVLASFLVQILKRAVFAPSPRPLAVFERSQTLIAENVLLPLQNAFPSGHTTTAFAFATLIALRYNRPSIQIVAAILAVGVAVSRVYLMAHWVADVMAGALLGMLLALLVHSLFKPKNKKAAHRAAF